MKEIAEYPNYKVTRNGAIIGARSKILKPDVNSSGYLRVTLCRDGVTKRRFVHQIVAETFLAKPDGKVCVNHIDSNRQNNHVDNLEWTTWSENCKHGFKLGRLHPLTGKRARKYFED